MPLALFVADSGFRDMETGKMRHVKQKLTALTEVIFLNTKQSTVLYLCSILEKVLLLETSQKLLM